MPSERNIGSSLDEVKYQLNGYDQELDDLANDLLKGKINDVFDKLYEKKDMEDVL